MKEYGLVLLNMLSFFAAVMAVVSWYQTIVPLHRRFPWAVTRVPLLAGIALVVLGLWKGWFPSVWLLVGGFLGTVFVTSFALSFLCAWALRGRLDEDERAHGHQALSPALVTWSLSLLVMLAMVAVNSATFGVKSPFWIHVG
jgi:hypothetical protein